MNDLRRHPRSTTALLFSLAFALAACSAGGGSTPTPSPSPDAPTSPTPDAPTSAPPADVFVPPLEGEPKIVVPRPGQIDVREIAAESLHAAVDGRSVTLAIDWWSGVEPCSILDSIVVATGDGSFAVTLREGRGPEEVACIAIAEQHRAFVELGELEPGTYTIRDAAGGAPPIEVTVS